MGCLGFVLLEAALLQDIGQGVAASLNFCGVAIVYGTLEPKQYQEESRAIFTLIADSLDPRLVEGGV